MDVIFVTYGFAVPLRDMLPRVGLADDAEEARDFAALAGDMLAVAEECLDTGEGGPGAAYVRAGVEYVGGGGRVVLGGTALCGPLLARNLLGVEWAYPHVATCGRGLEQWAEGLDSPLTRYWADEIMRCMLEGVGNAVASDIVGRFGEKGLAFMSPGSVAGWALEGQRGVFGLLGAAPGELGITLLEDMTMRPLKSVSGILFPSPEGWSNCGNCDRERCPGRREGAAGGCGGCQSGQ